MEAIYYSNATLNDVNGGRNSGKLSVIYATKQAKIFYEINRDGLKVWSFSLIIQLRAFLVGVDLSSKHIPNFRFPFGVGVIAAMEVSLSCRARARVLLPR